MHKCHAEMLLPWGYKCAVCPENGPREKRKKKHGVMVCPLEMPLGATTFYWQSTYYNICGVYVETLA